MGIITVRPDEGKTRWVDLQWTKTQDGDRVTVIAVFGAGCDSIVVTEWMWYQWETVCIAEQSWIKAGFITIPLERATVAITQECAEKRKRCGCNAENLIKGPHCLIKEKI